MLQGSGKTVTCVAPPQVPFTFGVEIFEPGHRTTPHSHASAHELFFILAGAPGAVRHVPPPHLAPTVRTKHLADAIKIQTSAKELLSAALSLNNELWLQ